MVEVVADARAFTINSISECFKSALIGKLKTCAATSSPTGKYAVSFATAGCLFRGIG